MITTADRAKVGQTTYRASGDRWQDDEPVEINGCYSEYKTLTAAKLVARGWAKKKGATHISIWRGTWEAEDIDDDEHGVILHANWVEDEHWAVNGYVRGDGGVDWEAEEW